MTEAVSPPAQPLEIRGRPRPVKRFSKRALMVLLGTGSAIVLGSLAFALQGPKEEAGGPPRELYNTGHNPEADGLAVLPKSYSELEQQEDILGPPLPGDLGTAILKAQREGRMGLPEEDFNSYATHRGDHLTAQRATLANPKLFNEMVKDEDGKVVQGSLARVEPEGKVTRMWEAIETYMERKQPLIIIAGADYGQGSSRDWAAKGVALAGVEAIVAEGFERIHRTNLIGMGVMPLQFQEGTTRHTLGIDGTEVFDVEGEPSPRAELTLVMHRANGDVERIPVICRLDTAEEVSVYSAGGILQRFAKDFMQAAS